MIRRALPLLAVLALTAPAPAQLTFAFDYSLEAANVGFNDPTWGTARRDALQSAGNMLASYLTGNPEATITIQVTSYSNSLSQTLASAGGYFYDSIGFQKTAAQILAGGTSLGGPHGLMNWNFGHSYGLGDSIGGTEYDFKAVAMHELTHVLGFISFINDLEQGFHENTSGTPDTWSDFDRFLTDINGTPLIDEFFRFNTSLSGITGGPTPSDIYFSGANAVAANNGNLVPIYSPTTFLAGSSLGHLDSDNPLFENALMSHEVSTGLAIRTLSALELAILTDLGYNVSAIPEPSTYAALIGCVALLVAYRRRRAA